MRIAGILRGRLRLLVNAFGGGRSQRASARAWLDLALMVALATMSWVALSRLFERMALDAVPRADAAMALAFVLTLALIGLAVFDLHHAVSALVLDSDLELLRRSPLTPAAIALLKLFDALPNTGVLLLVLAGPAVLAFARAYPIGAFGLLLLPLQAAAMWVVPLALGMSASLVMLRLLPPRAVRDALGALAALTLTLLSLGNVFLLPRVTSDGPGLSQPLVRAGHALERVAGMLPSYWWAAAMNHEGARAAARRMGNDTGMSLSGGMSWNLRLALAALAALALLMVVASRHLEPVLSAAAAGSGRRRAGARTVPRPRFGGGSIAAIIRRDARQLARDWPVLSDVVVASALWVLLPLVAVPIEFSGSAPLAQGMVVTLAVAMGYEVAARSVPFERGGLAWVRLAPIEPSRWVLAKLLGAAALALPLLGAAAIAVEIRFRPGWSSALPGAVVALSALATSLALGVWTGLRFGDPKWTNPRAMLRLGGRLLATVALVGQLLGWVAFLGRIGLGADGHTRAAWLLLAPLFAVGMTLLLMRAASGEIGRLEPTP